MKNAVLGFACLMLCLTSGSTVYGQMQEHAEDTTEIPGNWFLLDPETDNVQGVSVEKAYTTLLKGKPSRSIVVAVIDSGVDPDHEDLKDVMWTNKNEITGNGIDDDKNGYIDDIHGWNFIGGKNGSVGPDTYELTREYVRLKSIYENANEKTVKKNKSEYEYWKKIKEKFERLSKFNNELLTKYTQEYALYTNVKNTIHHCDSLLRNHLNVDDLTPSSLASIETSDDTLLYAKQTMEKIFQSIDKGIKIGEFMEELGAYLGSLKEQIGHYEIIVKYGYNTEFDSRTIVGDTYSNLNEKNYGNNDVMGPDASHGTHVAGIIAAPA